MNMTKVSYACIYFIVLLFTLVVVVDMNADVLICVLLKVCLQ